MPNSIVWQDLYDNEMADIRKAIDSGELVIATTDAEV